jgi:hypothetical protein
LIHGKALNPTERFMAEATKPELLIGIVAASASEVKL